MRLFGNALFRLRALSAADRRDVVRAQIALCAAQLRVWTRPEGRLIEPLSDASARTVDRHARLTSRRLARSVTRAARYGLFRPSCLVRALALAHLLVRDGISGGRIRVGVRERHGHFEAHAWVELAGEVLGDAPAHAAAFATLVDVRPVEVSR